MGSKSDTEYFINLSRRFVPRFLVSNMDVKAAQLCIRFFCTSVNGGSP